MNSMANRIAIIAVAIAVVLVLRTVEIRYAPRPRLAARDAIVNHFVHPLARPFANVPTLDSAATAMVLVVPDVALAFVLYFALEPRTRKRR